jgi:hypothetical protein
MALVKVTALRYITIIDPFPMEGVGHVTIQLAPGQFKTYQMYDHQADRLEQDYLKKAQVGGFITYEIDWDDTPIINTKKYIQFSFIDVVPGTRMSLGLVLGGVAVEETAVKILSSFDGGTQISVGDDLVVARLQKVTDNKPNKIGQYKVDNDFRYTVSTEIFVYFPAGVPTTGTAEVFVYLA